VHVKIWQIAVIAVVVIAVGVGAFFGGKAAGGGTPTPEEAMAVLRNLTPEQTQQAFQGNNGSGNGVPNGGFPGGNRVQGGGNAVSGSIIASDESSITVETTDGSSKIVLISGSTTISKTEEASPADLTTGEDVIVFGTTNDDGTVTATRIQLGADQAQFQGQPPGGANTPTTVAQ
jgi:hypothetical protein